MHFGLHKLLPPDLKTFVYFFLLTLYVMLGAFNVLNLLFLAARVEILQKFGFGVVFFGRFENVKMSLRK